MKIPNYDSDFSVTTGYKQGHPSMPADVFRMLICGPSNSGKTNILLHMIYKLLEFDKVYLFSKNLHQNKYQALLRDFASNIDADVGYEVIEAPGDEIIPLEELPVDNQKIAVFDDLVCESNQTSEKTSESLTSWGSTTDCWTAPLTKVLLLLLRQATEISEKKL